MRRRASTFAVVGLAAAGLLVPTAVGSRGTPSMSFDQFAWDFGIIHSGTTASKSFTLTNFGPSATGALTVSLTGSSAFSKTADTCTGASLRPRKSCTVTVQYAPTTEGSSDSGTLQASGRKPLAVATVSLTGASTAVNGQSQPDCESYGGTFATGTGNTMWTCTNWVVESADDYLSKSIELGADCFADGGSVYFDYLTGPFPVSYPTTYTATCSSS